MVRQYRKGIRRRIGATNKTAGSFDQRYQTQLNIKAYATIRSRVLAPAPKLSARLLHRRGLADLLLDRSLQVQRARRQNIGAGLQQEGVEAAIVVDAFQRIGRDAQAHVAAERVRDEGDVAQVRQETPLGLDVRMAHLVAHLRALGGQFTAPRHCSKSSSIPAAQNASLARPAGVQNHVHFQEPRTYRARGPMRQGLRGYPFV